jgi:hypothetical protein
MKTIEITGFIWAKKYSSCDVPNYHFFPGDGDNEYFLKEGYLPICAHKINVEMPAEFNLAKRQIESLNAKKKLLQFEFNQRVMEINDEISNLQCLEFNPS